MKTPAILSPAAMPVPSARPADAAPDMMFNQVLSREMAERAAEAGKPAPRENSGAEKDRPASSAPPAEAEKPGAADASDADARVEAEDETIPAAASAELLALMASLTQVNAAGPASAAAQPEDAGTALGDDKPGRRGEAGLAALLNSKLAGEAAADAETAAPAIDAAAPQAAPDSALPAAAGAGIPEDFAAAMESAAKLRAAHPSELMAEAPPGPQAIAAPAPLNNPQAAAQAADRLAPRVGAEDWNQALGQKVVWMVAGAQQSASLTLNPPDLGPLHVVLHVTNSHATANFTAAQPEVRQALENAMPKLREMLGDAGIQLGQANVSAGTPNNQQGGFGGGRQPPGRGSSGSGADDAGNAPVRMGRAQGITGGNGLVDTFA